MNLDTHIIGDTMDFTVSVADYPASDGWTLKYIFVARAAGGSNIGPLACTTNADGERYDMQVAPATTAAWTAGFYTWTRWVEKVGARQTLESGQLKLIANPETAAAGTDGRSVARKALEDLQAAYATFNATNGRVTGYSINGRSVQFESSSEILKAMDYWQRQVNREEAEERLTAGAKSPNKLFVRLG